MKNNNKKGFTLMELLIVIAIIVILVAIAIPVFSGQLNKAKEATDTANVRSWYAQENTNYMTDPENYTAPTSYTGEKLKVTDNSVAVSGSPATSDFKVIYQDKSKKAIATFGGKASS